MARQWLWGVVMFGLLCLAALASMIRIVPSLAPAPAAAPATATAPPPVDTSPALQVVAAGETTDPVPLVVPVQGVHRAQLTDTWGQSRANGAREHHAIDIMAARGTPVLAAASGHVEKIFESAAGGHTVYIRLADGRTVHYYAHLDAYAPGLHEGQQVAQGDMIATVGSTGDASPDAPHLHFEIKTMAPGERWWQGINVNPFPLLVQAQ